MRIGITVYSSDPYGTCRNIECSECGKPIGKQRKLGGKYAFYDDLWKDEYIYCPFCAHKFNKDILKEGE